MNGNPLPSGSFLPSDGVGDIFDVISKEGPKLVYVVQVIDELKKLLRNLNANNNSALIMEKLVKAADKLNGFLSDGRNLMADIRGEDKKNLRDSAVHLKNILAKIDKGEGTLGALINDPSLHEQLLNMVGKRPRNSYLKPLIRATLKKRDEKH